MQINRIRNFSIIAHIDHGKSTLADRLLEKTNFSKINKPFERILDSLALEQEKGITIKLNSVQLLYPPSSSDPYIFNLIDTPGHVDFMYEVSRSLAACEGVILLVDATKGIQAQTMSYYRIAKDLNLDILPVINKIDLASANVEEAKLQIINLLKCQEDDICLISAKTGKNIDLLCDKIVDSIRSPKNENKKSLRGLVFDLLYNKYYGVIVYLKIVDGEIKSGQKVKFFSNQKEFQVERLGVKTPKELLKNQLITGEIGWFSANIRDMSEMKVGDTVFDSESDVSPLEGYKEIKSNVYSNIYPVDSLKYKDFKRSLEELQIQDGSLKIESINSQLLGLGFRCGFLGLLHREIICERIKKEYGCEIITTHPSVTYRINYCDGKFIETNNPQEIEKKTKIKSIEELFISIKIDSREMYLGNISELCQKKRGIFISQEWRTSDLYELHYHLPFSEFIIDFHDKLKSISHGYASFSYEFIGFLESDIVKIDIQLNGNIIPDLSFMVHKEFSYERSRLICEKLKNTLNKQNFIVPIQACIGGTVIARETLPALKKHVTGNMYGGDRTRKMKLWAKQKRGKARMKEFGKVDFGASNLREMLRNSN